MPSPWLALLRRRRLSLIVLASLLVLLPIGCAKLEQTERELVFRIEPGTARWFSGLPAGVEDVQLQSPALAADESLHAWWWPAPRKDAPALLYLHGSRWNLTGQLFRIEQLHAMGFSVLAVDYRGFGQSRGPLPSERSVYQDALIAWEHLARLQPEASKRFIYGHSLGGAVAVNLAHELADDKQSPQAAGLIVESSFTNLGDVATAVSNTSLPVRWLLSQEFDSLSKIGAVGVPVLIAHGRDDRYVPARFSEALFDAAREPKQLLLIDGANHNNSLRMAANSYRQALQTLGLELN
ncbi:alpha/beta hydrolase [Ectopseudomonas oleovorans]|uniref:Alpha/beta fold family hydrolase-like protein n=1 Tax=Ectopseudomonas oleovorans TaxID=301 RepID=A0A2S7FQ77_ECTOL|nr:alpha/beta fold hydrolase [Pseudomonas oleovorans]MBP8884307.1 alpha/beta hydrolase [Pseudomonas sp.]MBN7119301.1 alpha/beta hydrolase [Pseudomonas oleovorans]MBN7131571.1 alpha/beta hydrolase [Pseudomonas oleovorans]MBN7143031.1 alpha/beta hydrolase [Pseudomonas oleovorans]MCR1826026.1 lysophospholipase [Pseudomonas oleovorans]